MPKQQEVETFAKLEKREWANADVAQSNARAFAKAADMVAPYLVNAVCAGPETEALGPCYRHGNVTSGFMKVGATATGLGFSPAMLNMARAAFPNTRFVEGDAMDLAFDDASFDAFTIGFRTATCTGPANCNQRGPPCLAPRWAAGVFGLVRARRGYRT